MSGQRRQPAGRRKVTAKQRRKRKLIIFLIEVILVLLLLAGIYIWQMLRKIDHPEGGSLDEDKVSININKETKEMLKGYTNIALFGLDNRSNGSYSSGNSDCIMVASINNDTKEVKIISLYRDTYLAVDEDDDRADSFIYSKVNSAYGRGGAENAVKALNRNLDLDIVQYACVDFNALTEVVDLLGGIDLDVPLTDEEAMYMNGASGKENYISTIQEVTGKTSNYVTGGQSHLDGVQATAYCRIRYTAGDDFKRTERQRTILAKMIEKAKTSDLLTLNKIVDAVFEDIETSLTSMEILGLASSMMDYELVDTHGFPFELTTGSYGSKGDLVVAADLETNVSELHEYLFGTKDYVPTKVVQGISQKVKNDTGVTAESAVRMDNPLTVIGDEEDSESSASDDKNSK